MHPKSVLNPPPPPPFAGKHLPGHPPSSALQSPTRARRDRQRGPSIPSHLIYLPLPPLLTFPLSQPDFYAFGPTWSPANYTQTWKTFATAVADVVRFKASGTTLQTGAFAGDNPFIWYPGAVLNAGLLDSKVAPVTSTFSEHMYYVRPLSLS